MLTLNFFPFPVLHTSRLTLRQVSPDDVNEMFALRSSKEVMQFIDRPMAITAEDALLFIQKIMDSLKNNEGITWAISLRAEPGLIGTIGFWRIDKDHHRAEIGYMLHPAWQRKGLMQEALASTLFYGFNSMRLHSVEANVKPANNASIQLLKKNDFKQEAYFRESYFYNGKFLDSMILCLLTPLK